MACLHEFKQFIEPVEVSGQGLGDRSFDHLLLERVPEPGVRLGVSDDSVDFDGKRVFRVEEVDQRLAGTAICPFRIGGVGLTLAELSGLFEQLG